LVPTLGAVLLDKGVLLVLLGAVLLGAILSGGVPKEHFLL